VGALVFLGDVPLPVGVEVSVDDDGAELEDDVGPFGGPPGPGDPESVFDDSLN